MIGAATAAVPTTHPFEFSHHADALCLQTVLRLEVRGRGMAQRVVSSRNR